MRAKQGCCRDWQGHTVFVSIDDWNFINRVCCSEGDWVFFNSVNNAKAEFNRKWDDYAGQRVFKTEPYWYKHGKFHRNLRCRCCFSFLSGDWPSGVVALCFCMRLVL
jgi:hypothetical protein